MHIGIDLDHTIIDYRNQFTERAFSLGYIDANETLTKDVVKKKVKELEDGEEKWGMLQAEVYSDGICKASVMYGFPEFVAACFKSGINLSIISHKTQSNRHDPLQRDLKLAALKWMEKNQFFNSMGLDFNLDHVFFTDSIEEKISTIADQECTHFIDDLLSLLLHPAFPENIQKIHFLCHSIQSFDEAVDYTGNWSKISKYLIYGDTHSV